MSANTSKLPSGVKLRFSKLRPLETRISFRVGTAPLAMDVEDIPKFCEEMRNRYEEIEAARKEIRRQYDAAHPNK